MENNNRQQLIITSEAFKADGEIPPKYTCEGEDINPPLHIAGMPDGTQSLALICEDPDAPKGTFDHWIVWNMPVEATVPENKMPGISGTNSAGKTGYHGPCPADKEHRYFFYVYALDTSLDIDGHGDKKTLKKAMEGHILAEGSLMGRYDLKNKR